MAVWAPNLFSQVRPQIAEAERNRPPRPSPAHWFLKIREVGVGWSAEC